MSKNSLAAPTHLDSVPTTIEVMGNSHWTAYTGTQADLVAAGIAPAELFPIWPKRRYDNYSPDTPRDQMISIQRMKGARFRVTLDRPLPPEALPPAPWDPVAFRSSMARWIGSAFEVAIKDARGLAEAEVYGRATHRMAEKDVQRLRALRDHAVSAILQAPVERVRGARLKLV